MYVSHDCIVSFRDPAVNDGKGLVYFKRFLGLISEFYHIHTTCGSHVMPQKHYYIHILSVDVNQQPGMHMNVNRTLSRVLYY